MLIVNCEMCGEEEDWDAIEEEKQTVNSIYRRAVEWRVLCDGCLKLLGAEIGRYYEMFKEHEHIVCINCGLGGPNFTSDDRGFKYCLDCADHLALKSV